MTQAPHGLLRRMFDAGIKAAQPAYCVPPHLPAPPRGRTLAIGAGKASAAMAKDQAHRVAKYNRLLRIEDELQEKARYAGAEAFPGS